jgi:hypothetical protein
MAKFNPKKFVFHELFTNTNGKQSGSGFIGLLMGVVSVIAFCVLIVGWWLNKPNVNEILEKILQFTLLATALLGVRKFSGAITNSKDSKTIQSDAETEETEETDVKP